MLLKKFILESPLPISALLRDSSTYNKLLPTYLQTILSLLHYSGNCRVLDAERRQEKQRCRAHGHGVRWPMG